MTYKWTATHPSMTLTKEGGSDINSALKAACDFIHADTMLTDIFNEPFDMEIRDETGKVVFTESQFTLQKADEKIGT